MRFFRKKKKTLQDHLEAFSQFEEEKILASLIKKIPHIDHTYVDIGASDGVRMSNTARLALEKWRGIAFEYDFKKVGDFAKNYTGLNNVSICNTKITPHNILSFLEGYETPKEFGFLSLDIDSYDYFVLEKILSHYRPTILLLEINEKIPPPLAFTVLYRDDFVWDGSHFFGQSISQVEQMAKKHDYSLVQLEYNNLFLVDKKYHKDSLTAHQAYLSGYAQKSDRKEKYPWNADMENLLTLSPEAALAFLNEKFSAYKGKFQLSLADT